MTENRCYSYLWLIPSREREYCFLSYFCILLSFSKWQMCSSLHKCMKVCESHLFMQQWLHGCEKHTKSSYIFLFFKWRKHLVDLVEICGMDYKLNIRSSLKFHLCVFEILYIRELFLDMILVMLLDSLWNPHLTVLLIWVWTGVRNPALPVYSGVGFPCHFILSLKRVDWS